MDYEIKYGTLKNKKVSDAFKEGKIKELLELREFLIKSYETVTTHRSKILEGITAIDYYILNDYSKKIKIFFSKYYSLSKSQQDKLEIKKHTEIFENNDLIGLNNLLEKMDKI